MAKGNYKIYVNKESNNIKVLLAKSYIDDFRFILQGITRGLRYIPQVLNTHL